MEATGSYDASFYLSGGLILASAIILYPLGRINVMEKGKQKKEGRTASVIWLDCSSRFERWIEQW